MAETWGEMTARQKLDTDRHRLERREMVLGLIRLRITQTDAAKLVGVSHRALNNYVQRNKMFWPVKQRSES